MQLVFVCGVRGSGTRLLLSLLSGHSQLFVTGREDGLASGLARGAEEFQYAIRKNAIGDLYRALHYYTEYQTFAGVLRQRSLHPDREHATHRSRVSTPIELAGFEGAFASRLLAPAGDRLRIRSLADLITAFYESLAWQWGESDKTHVVSKPGTGADVFLEAEAHFRRLRPRLLCLVRDPRAVVHSRIQGDSVRLVSTLARGWLEHVRAIARLREHYPVHLVPYEELCQKRGETMRGIARFLDIPFEDVLMHPRPMNQHSAPDPALGHLEADGSTRSLQHWRESLTERQTRCIEMCTGPALAEVGYTPECDQWTVSAIGRINSIWNRWIRMVNGELVRSRFFLAVAGLLLGMLIGLSLGRLIR